MRNAVTVLDATGDRIAYLERWQANAEAMLNEFERLRPLVAGEPEAAAPGARLVDALCHLVGRLRRERDEAVQALESVRVSITPAACLKGQEGRPKAGSYEEALHNARALAGEGPVPPAGHELNGRAG